MDGHDIPAKLEELWRARLTADPRMTLARWRERERDVEHRFTVRTPTSRVVFATLCALYGLPIYKRRRMHDSTACVDAPPGFVREVFAPQHEDMAQLLEDFVLDTTMRLVERWSGINVAKVPSP
jgi:hypothetical protein